MKVRPGILVSSVGHGAVLAWALVGFSSAKPFQVGQTESLPIEIISPEQFDQLTKGVKTSKVQGPPKIEAKKVADATPEPKPDLPEAKRDVEAPPPPPIPAPRPEQKTAEVKPEPPKPEPKPEPPKPEPPKPEPKPEPPKPKPEPPKPEPKPEPPKPEPPKPEPKPEPPKPEKKVEDQIKKELEKLQKAEEKKPEPKKPEPVKTASATPPKPVQTQEKHDRVFDPTKIAALANRQDPSRTASAGRETAQQSTVGVPTGTAQKLSLSQQSMIQGLIRDQVGECWNPPMAGPGEDLKVRVRFQLGPDGTLTGNPVVTARPSGSYSQAAADSATRAIRRCSPLKLPAQFYDYWKEVEITFDPREMLRG